MMDKPQEVFFSAEMLNLLIVKKDYARAHNWVSDRLMELKEVESND